MQMYLEIYSQTKNKSMAYVHMYIETSAQREYDKNVNVFVSGICITQRKIVSNCLQTIVFFSCHLLLFGIIIIYQLKIQGTSCK